MPNTIPANLEVYAADCTFANLGGDAEQHCDSCVGAINSDRVAVTVVNSTFFDLAALPDSLYVRAWNDGGVALLGCEFGPTTKPKDEPPFYASDEADLYSDVDVLLHQTNNAGVLRKGRPLEDLPQLPAGTPMRFLQRDDPWFVDIRKVCRCRRRRERRRGSLPCMAPVNVGMHFQDGACVPQLQLSPLPSSFTC